MIRNLILLVFLMASANGSNAQYVNVYLSDSTSQSYALADVSSITFNSSEMQMNFLGGSFLDWNTSIINYMDYDDSGLGLFESVNDLMTEFVVYPNPSNGAVHVKLESEFERSIAVEVYNIQGQQVKNLFRGNLNRSLLLHWNGVDERGYKLSRGVYLCTVTIGAQRISRTIVLIDK